MSSAVVDLYDEECLRFDNTELRTLADAKVDTQYTIRDIQSEDEELKNFLFSLGCYKGEEITIISILSENFVISIKDARYSIDTDLGDAIII